MDPEIGGAIAAFMSREVGPIVALAISHRSPLSFGNRGQSPAHIGGPLFGP